MNTIRILCVAVAVFAVYHVEANPLLKRPDAAEYQKCKNLCGLCDCVGFYCGDECICECHNKTDDGNLNCIDDMQNNCEKSAVPFEVLIQGPSGNRFVRSLVLADSNVHQVPVDPTHVSTISIFQPNDDKKHSKREAKPDIDGDVAEALADSVNADAATIDEQTANRDAAAAPADNKKEENVGIALPVAPLIGAKLLPLKAHLDLLRAGLGAKFLPLGVHAALKPGILGARLTGLKTQLGLGLLPLGI